MRTDFVVPADLDPLRRHPKAAAPGEPIRWHNPMCFGCGSDAPQGLGLVVRAAAEEFTVETSLVVEKRFEGGPGVIHGGILSTAFDEVMGTAPLLIGASAVTGHLEVDFLAPVPLDSTVVLRAHILGRQRRKIYVEATAHLDDPEKPVALGRSIFIAIDAREHFADYIDKSGLSDEQKGYRTGP
ncbi:MAG: PaaI family thioesterase [Gordonia sp. (in: high G+C Gram-positive bacteria)]